MMAWDVPSGLIPSTYPENAPRGPVVAIADECSGSDGDIVTAAIRTLRLGPVVGARTWGGVIGYDHEHELIDEHMILGDEIGQIMRSRNATIVDLRKREEELEEALRRLEAQDRLVSLGLLSASVAHELNTPLTVLQGSIEKLSETTEDSATLERLARIPGGGIRLRTTPQVLSPTPTVRAAAMAHFATTGKGRTTTLGRASVRTFPKRAAWNACRQSTH